jgi:DNA-binding NtrC family response regulator
LADVRVISATHRDLRAGVNTGAFRADLYYRLAVARILVPPLRQRPQDIERLAQHFATEFCGAPTAAPFGAAELAALSQHFWAGNVRELRNVVEAALATGQPLPELTSSSTPNSDPNAIVPYKEARASIVESFERQYLSNLISACQGNASEAARRAQMDRAYLVSLLKRHGLR